MADEGGGDFAVLVTGFSQITKRGIKNKLAAYFQSRKKSGGGECDVKIVENGDALVTFYKKDVQTSVLERTHTITLDGQNIHLSVTQYSGKHANSEDDVQKFSSLVKQDSTCASEVSPSVVQDESNEQSGIIDSHRICIKLQNEEIEPELFRLYIECCSGTNAFHVLHTNETSIFIVEFTDNIDLNKAVCTFNNKKFGVQKPVAEHLPRTRCLQVTQLPESVVEDYLVLYFERLLKYDSNLEAHLDKSTQSAIMIFRNPEAVEHILSETHTIKGHTLKMHRYYEGEKLTEFTSEQDRNDSNLSKKDKEDSESLTQKNEDGTELASSFVTEECRFKNKYNVLILKNQGLENEWPHIQLHFDMTQNAVQITGMENDVLKIQLKLFNKENQITMKIVHLSKHLRIFLTQLNNEGFLTQMFLDSEINAVYTYDDAEDKGVLYAASEKDQLKAEEKLKVTFAEVTIPIPVNFYVDSANTFKLLTEKTTTSVKGKHLELKDVKEKYLLQHYVESKATSGQSACIILVGYRVVVEEAKIYIEKYMNENCMKDMFIEVPSLGVFEYIQKFVNFSNILKDVNVDFVKNDQSLRLQIRVSMKNAAQTQAIIVDVLKQVKVEAKQLCKPGAIQFFAKNQDLLKKLENPYQCVIHIENQKGQQTDLALSKKPQIVSTVMFLNKFKISVVKQNLAIYEVDAILHLTNEMFDYSTGLSKTLVEAGGPELQETVDRLRKNRHFMKESVMIPSTPGKLPCSLVLHAKWTKSDRKDVEEETVLKDIILAALNAANDHLYISLAIPVFSSDESSIWIMVKAVKKYCEQYRESNPRLTDIRLVSTDDASIKMTKKVVKQVIEPKGKHSNLPVMKLAIKCEKKNSSANTVEPQQEASRLPSMPKMLPDTAVPEIDPASSEDTFVTSEGLKVILVKGNIGDQKCDVIVNTVSVNMNLSQGPVSIAILKQAGAQLQANTDEAKGSKKLKAGDVLPVSTIDCELHCQEVYNVICCNWSTEKASPAEEMLQTIIQKCLKYAHTSQYKSMSFPAIGTGNLKFPKDIVAEIFFEEIKKFSNANPMSTLKEVRLIIYEKDLAIYSAFEEALLIAEGNPINELNYSREIRSARKVDSETANTIRTTEPLFQSLFLKHIGKIIFELGYGGISNRDIALVVEYVENKANSDIKQKGDIHYIPVRMKGQADIARSFLKVLQKCRDYNYHYLYIPVPKQLPSGRALIDIKVFAAAVLDSVRQYGQMMQVPSIHVIVNEASPAHIPVFQEEITKLQTGKEGILNTVSKYFAGWPWLIGNQSSEDTNVPQHSVEPVKFQIYSMKEENIQEVWADIEKLVTKEHLEKTIPVEIPLEKFTEEDFEEIIECCFRMHVIYRFDKTDRSIFLSGCITDICSVQDVIFKVCHDVGKREVILREEMFIMDKVCWKFWVEDHWVTFNPTVNAQLEKAYNEKENEIKVRIDGGDCCVIDFQKYTLTDADGNSFRIDRRCTGDELPDCWEIGENETTCSEVHLKPDSLEYQEVARDFQSTLGNVATSQTFNIDSITRIQNPTLWRLYVAKRNEMNKKRPHQQNEKFLYHGTSSETCSKINVDGFNRSYCGLNAVYFGDGTYFARNATYSAQDTYSKPDATGCKVVYRARVLTGDYCKGKPGLKEPPLKDQQAHSRDRYDSVTDNVLSPEVFVVFQDNQAYPEYLITFHV
ncbi:protein mono-ADP-ribosyltransferase PARP14-like isoform X2 [Carcharodon carcharias]|uniref:protein mono-ADP-ribosyltransferase PARP14-like isoform X2 n=1 Tax=Carcharodon carcharias TaxID=13397 RepID=UPI001B7E36AE|nr:protein mono-ADP-ribosyltransferase PARP14-like isoform X2 [Carcharodon carcharias]